MGNHVEEEIKASGVSEGIQEEELSERKEGAPTQVSKVTADHPSVQLGRREDGE